jgi:SAM-dependent methyltransferase
MEPERPRAEHARAFDAGAAEKLALLAPTLQTRRCRRVVDAGTGAGAVAAGLARHDPRREVIGIDRDAGMLAIAERRRRADNLRFACADVCEELPGGADLVVMSSVLHEVYSWSADGLNSVARALRNAHRSLLPGGLLLVRDFVRPEGGEALVELHHERHDVRPERSMTDFAASACWPVRLDAARQTASSDVYATDLASAHEFLWRKDHAAAWGYELRERYGFWSSRDAKAMLFRAGFSRVRSELLPNRWMLAQRAAGRVELRDRASGRRVPPPLDQIVLFAER